MFPAGYGLAWRCWERPGCICYPIPINLVMGWLHSLWLELQMPRSLREDLHNQGLHGAAFARGVQAGRLLERRHR